MAARTTFFIISYRGSIACQTDCLPCCHSFLKVFLCILSLFYRIAWKMFFVLFVIRWLIYTKLQKSDLEYNSISFCKLAFYILIIWILHLIFASWNHKAKVRYEIAFSDKNIVSTTDTETIILFPSGHWPPVIQRWPSSFTHNMGGFVGHNPVGFLQSFCGCLLYTSDAADD